MEPYISVRAKIRQNPLVHFSASVLFVSTVRLTFYISTFYEHITADRRCRVVTVVLLWHWRWRSIPCDVDSSPIDPLFISTLTSCWAVAEYSYRLADDRICTFCLYCFTPAVITLCNTATFQRMIYKVLWFEDVQVSAVNLSERSNYCRTVYFSSTVTVF